MLDGERKWYLPPAVSWLGDRLRSDSQRQEECNMPQTWQWTSKYVLALKILNTASYIPLFFSKGIASHPDDLTDKIKPVKGNEGI